MNRRDVAALRAEAGCDDSRVAVSVALVYALTGCVLGAGLACGDPSQLAPDASQTLDAADADAIDAAGRVCADGLLCFSVTPLTPSTQVSEGRLVVAWLPVDGEQYEIGYDVPWSAGDDATVLRIAVLPPSVTHQFESPCDGTGAFAVAAVVLSMDPDADGQITSDEIVSGRTSFTLYGVHQEVVAWSSAPCARSQQFPDGLRAGVHAYSVATPVRLLDGTWTEIVVCTAGTSECSKVPNPFD